MRHCSSHQTTWLCPWPGSLWTAIRTSLTHEIITPFLLPKPILHFLGWVTQTLLLTSAAFNSNCKATLYDKEPIRPAFGYDWCFLAAIVNIPRHRGCSINSSWTARWKEQLHHSFTSETVDGCYLKYIDSSHEIYLSSPHECSSHVCVYARTRHMIFKCTVRNGAKPHRMHPTDCSEALLLQPGPWKWSGICGL